ncbi:MAG TPA: hypothetical protein VNI83_13725 [Vicinamibacterales bacterium]|nr:hypothetical protein [Vicinamibacterales bacterium]
MTLASVVATADAGPVVFKAAGQQPADIQAAVDAFRAFLGQLNPNVAGSFPDGRREINWDAVPDGFSAPNNLPARFFNVNSPRGVVFFTPGTGFQVSADSANPTATPVEFGNIHPLLPLHFRTFSPERLFTALDSNITEVLFFVPGEFTPATTHGFGVVFTGVNRSNTARIEYFDVAGNLLYSQDAPRGTSEHDNLSFVGVAFDAGERVYLVRITSGNVLLSSSRGIVPLIAPPTHPDLVAMDDFIYGEPQPVQGLR